MHSLEINPAGALARAFPYLNILQSHASLRRAQEKHA